MITVGDDINAADAEIEAKRTVKPLKGKQMSKTNLFIVGLILLVVSIGCTSFMPAKTSDSGKVPTIDFNSPGTPLDVQVTLDKKQTASGKVSTDGGSLSLTSADGSKFTLDIPAKALDIETTITMTAVKNLDGSPLDKNTPTAVQLEPSGLFFSEMVTLTIVPAKDIPVTELIAFGYEKDGKDYHLALVDPKSKDIKIKLMEFSGAGVGSGGDAAWAAHLQIQAETTRTRLTQKLAEINLKHRRNGLIWGTDSSEWVEEISPLMDEYDDQVLRKEMVAAELDCRLAWRAAQNVLGANHQRSQLGVNPDPNFLLKVEKLGKIAKECKKGAAFQIVGGLDDWQTSTKVCDIMQPFKLTAGGFVMDLSGGLAGTYKYTGPYAASGTGTYTISLPNGLDKPGTMTGTGDGAAGGATNSGTEKYTLTPIEPCS
jgi:hypothetical protein